MQLLKFTLAGIMPCLALCQGYVGKGMRYDVTKASNKRALGFFEKPIYARQVPVQIVSDSVTTAVSVVVVDVYPTISTSTILSTSTVTVHQCPATVLDCPARSRSISYVTSVVPVSISLCPTTYVSYSFSAMPTTYASGSGPSSSVNGTYGISTTVITHTPGPTISYTPVPFQAPSATPPAYVPTPSTYTSPSSLLPYGGSNFTSTVPTASTSHDVSRLTTASSVPTIVSPSVSILANYNASWSMTPLYPATRSATTQMYSLSTSNLSVSVPPPAYPSSLLPPPYGVTPTSIYTTVISTSGYPAYTATYTTVGLPPLHSLESSSVASAAGYTIVVGGSSSLPQTTVISHGPSYASVLPLVTPTSAPVSQSGYTVVVGPGPSTFLTTVIPYGAVSTPVSSAASYTIIVGGPYSTLTTEVPAYGVSMSSMMTYPVSGYTTIVYPGHESSGLITTVIPVTGYTTGPAASAEAPTYTLPPGISSPAPGYSASVIIPGSTTIVIPPAMSATANATPGGVGPYANGTVTQTAAPTSYTGGASKHVVACLAGLFGLAITVLAA